MSAAEDTAFLEVEACDTYAGAVTVANRRRPVGAQGLLLRWLIRLREDAHVAHGLVLMRL